MLGRNVSTFTNNNTNRKLHLFVRGPIVITKKSYKTNAKLVVTVTAALKTDKKNYKL